VRADCCSALAAGASGAEVGALGLELPSDAAVLVKAAPALPLLAMLVSELSWLALQHPAAPTQQQLARHPNCHRANCSRVDDTTILHDAWGHVMQLVCAAALIRCRSIDHLLVYRQLLLAAARYLC
jgi:hypothetical protein